MTRLDSWFAGGHAQVRSLALGMTIPLLLTLDAVFMRVGRAAAYGADGFNVAHFAWLGAYQGDLSPGLYIGTLVIVAVLGWALTLGGYSRWLIAALLVVYTYSWSMSRLDSFEHHDFLSWVLVCMLFLPSTGVAEVSERPNASCHEIGFPLLCGSAAILYFWAAVGMMESAWLSGQTLHGLSQIEESLGELVALAGLVGASPEQFWTILAWVVIVVELGIGCGYVFAMQRDRAISSFARTACTWAWIGAMSLHLGAEAIGMPLGWFSFYMIALASICLLPARIVTVLTWPFRMLGEASSGVLLAVESHVGRRLALVLGLGAAAWAILLGRKMSLPGAETAVLTTIVALAVSLIATGNARKPEALRRASLLALAVTLCWLTLSLGNARFDFYRRLARDLERQDRPEEALSSYVEAQRFAPEEQSRESLQQP